MPNGSLVVVGTGIKMAAHITVEAKAWIEQADQVFFLVSGEITEEWILQLNPQAVNLAPLYAQGKRRLDTYREMIERILGAVRQGQRVCAVFYGHPGVFVLPSHQAIRQARSEGFEARMLPGISAEDCLFADVGLDPAWSGCQSFEATDFLVRSRRFDTRSHLVLWQIGVIGNPRRPETGENLPGLAVLVEALEAHYGLEHEVIIYEASPYPGFDPVIQRIALGQVQDARITPISTMLVPPKEQAPLDAAMLERLGLSLQELEWKGG
jgi:precorrin-6B methylase 1